MSNISNATDFGMHPSNTAGNNVTDLQAAVATAISTGGGTVIIPCFNASIGTAGNYQMAGTVAIGNGSTVVGEIVVAGTTGNVELVQTNAVDLFEINNAATSTVGGTYFHDFEIAFGNPLTSGAGLNFIAGQNPVVERVVFNDNPTAVLFQDILDGTVRNCTFVWKLQNIGTGVNITGPHASGSNCNQIHVEKCDFRTSNVPNSYIAILINQCEHAVIGPAVSIAGPNQGILIQPVSTSDNNIWNITIIDVESGTPAAGLAVMPCGTGGSWVVGTVTVVGGYFTQTSPPHITYDNGGLYFDTGGGAASQLDGVKLIGVVSQGWMGPGLQINAGQNFEIVGGTYAGNGQGSGISAGHLISGNALNITATGVDLSATYTGPGGTSSAQTYALYISGNPSYVSYNGCLMLNYMGSPVQITGSPSHLRITNCPGYNDQNTPVSSSVPTASTMAASHNYYGPSQITFSGGTTSSYTLNSVTYAITSGQINLASPYDTIYFNGIPTTFSWIGK